MGFDKIESDTKWVYSLKSWNTNEWLDKSKTGSSNRKSGDINCAHASSRHTGGLMGIMTIGKGHMIGNLVGKNSSYKPTSPKSAKKS
ncbi:hypothetical protein Hanom_Chr10g00913601 [Helianthus anomalus]